MGPAARTSAAVASAAGIWCAAGALATSTIDTSSRLGLLPPWWLLLALLVASGIAWLGSGRLPEARDRLLPLLLLPGLALPWLPGAVPAAFMLWTGRLGWVLAAASLGCVAWPWWRAGLRGAGPHLGEPRRALSLAFAAAAVLFVAGGWNLQGMVPGGDEPHYLVITQSLLKDGDLQIENNHRNRDYAPYFAGTLRPDYLRRGQNRQIYSVHAPGISAFVAPAFAVAGYPGVLVWLALVCAAGTALAWYAAWRLTGRAGAAWYAWAAATFSVSFTIQAFSVYPDATASVIALSGVLALILPAARPAWQWALHGAALAALPWLHTRHAVIAGLLGLFLVLRLLAAPARWQRLAALLTVPLVSAAGWFGYFWVIYGTVSPSAPYGTLRQASSPSFLPVTLPGLLFDQQFGLVTYAPVLGVALLGLVLLAVRRRAIVAHPDHVDGRLLAVQVAVLVVAYAVSSGTYRMWWAGSSSPARFLVPLILPLAVAAGAAWAGLRSAASRWMALAALWATVAITAILLTVDGGRLAFNWRDGYALLADWLSPAADLPHALPSLIRDPLPLALARIAAWMGALLAAWVALRAADRGGRLRPGARTLAGGGLLLAAAMVATTIGWWAGAAAPLRPGASQAWLLSRASAFPPPGAGVSGGPWPRLGPVAGVLGALELRAEARQRLGPGELLVVNDMPAGRYSVHVAAGPAPRQGTVYVGVGRGPAIATIGLGETEAVSEVSQDILLPVPARAIAVTADERARETVRAAWLVPRDVNMAAARGPGRAVAGARYPTATAFSLDDRSFVEPGGIWVRPGAPAAFVAVPHQAGRLLRLQLAGGQIANTCTIVAGNWRSDVSLAAGASQVVLVPVPPRAPVVAFSVAARTYFRPADVDPQSQDTRALGCRLEFP